MSFEQFNELMLPAIEDEITACIETTETEGLEELHFMLAYHLGMAGPGAGRQARGKHVRPLLVLLTCAAAGGDWQKALPAAAAVELVHNFSLIHDDIQDDSPLRRGRETLWKKWGIPLAINTGDSMYALAHIALKRLAQLVPAETALQAHQILPEACLTLTQGQFLDLMYETSDTLTTADYWPMIQGKTAALLAACTELGALIAGVDAETQATYKKFGNLIGRAFQVQDDILGIWGDAALTGKSAESDLLAGKKSLPVLYALEQHGAFAERWAQGPITLDDVAEATDLLTAAGALDYTQQTADRLTGEALEVIEDAAAKSETKQALIELSEMLVRRKA